MEIVQSLSGRRSEDLRAAMPHPLGVRARILLTSVFGPYAQDDEYGSRAINPMELYHNQVTRVQGPFSLRMFHRSWGLMLIQANVTAPCVLLDFPTQDRFIKELKKPGYDIVGISSITTNLLKVEYMCRLVRELQSHGIHILGSTIIGLDHHTPENIDQAIDYAVGHGTDFHQFMLYMPLPGTPLHEEMAAQGLLLDEAQCPIPDTHGQFRFNYRHPHIPEGLESQLILRAFQRDFEVNGPSILRVLRTTLAGWKRHRDHLNPRIRRRLSMEVNGMVSAFSVVAGAATRYYRNNQDLHARMASLLEDLKREFGWKSRLYATLGGPYLLRKIRSEEARLSRGWAYEPPTFYEINEAADPGYFPGAFP